MNSRIISGSKIKGKLKARPSKSVMQRALLIALLAEGKSILKNPSYSEDSLALINILRKLGAKLQKDDNKLEIDTNDIFQDKTRQIIINCGESGLCARMIPSVLSLFDKDFVIKGEGSLKKRTLSMVEQGLNDANIICESNNGYLPLKIKGPLIKNNFKIDASLSSQFLSGLLIALPVKKTDSIIEVKEMKSRPYIDLTLDMIKNAGVDIIENPEKKLFMIKGNQKYMPLNITVENDWSSASFLLVAAAVGGEIEIRGLNLNSKQADRAILYILKEIGAVVEAFDDTVIVRNNELKAFSFDISDAPDLFPPLATLAVFCTGKSVIYGINRLKHKESSRAEVIENQFTLLGIDIKILDNRVEIIGGKINEGVCSARGDHRIAMALSILATGSNNSITIDEPECVNKSYPEFFEDLKAIGGIIK